MAATSAFPQEKVDAVCPEQASNSCNNAVEDVVKIKTMNNQLASIKTRAKRQKIVNNNYTKKGGGM